jgi:hypothetical protein
MARGAELEQWIAQLSSDDWRVRQQAMERLVGMGEDALPRLNNLANTTDDGEVRTRASAAIAQIEENRITGASLITMKLEGAPAATAFAQLASQAGAPLLTEPPNLLSQKNMRLVSLNADHRPFWEVMQTLCAQTELEPTGISRHNREIGLGLIRGSADWMDKPIVVSGPLLIRADRLVRISTAHLKPPGGVSEEFTISLTAFAEPKLKVLDYSTTLKLEEAVDELGNSLVPPVGKDAVAANAIAFGNTREGNTSHWEVGATLHHPKGAGKRIVRFRATAALQVQTRAAVLELPVAASKNVSRTLGGLRVTIKSIDNTRCDLCVYRDGRTDAEWYAARMQLYAGEAQLLDEKGQVVARSQSGMEADESPDSQRMDLRLRFAREGAADEGKKRAMSEAAKMIWSFPIQTRELTVPLEFQDLPIP